jgi:hypothetical protein
LRVRFQDLCEDERQRDEAPPSSGQHLRIGSSSSVPSLRRPPGTRRRNRLRHEVAQPADQRHQLERIQDAPGHRGRHQLLDLAPEVVERLDAKGEPHALDRAKDIRRDRDTEAGRMLEHQGGSTTGRLACAIGDGRDLQIRGDLVGHPGEQLAAIEVGDEVVQIWVHARARMSRTSRSRRPQSIVRAFAIFASS